MSQFWEWTKKLGQKHWALIGRPDGRPLCGKPMLGNNYARSLGEDEKKECEQCAKKRKELECGTTNQMAVNGGTATST